MHPESRKPSVTKRMAGLLRWNELLKQNCKLDTWQSWNYDLEAGPLTLSNDDIPRVIATTQAGETTSNNPTKSERSRSGILYLVHNESKFCVGKQPAFFNTCAFHRG